MDSNSQNHTPRPQCDAPMENKQTAVTEQEQTLTVDENGQVSDTQINETPNEERTTESAVIALEEAPKEISATEIPQPPKRGEPVAPGILFLMLFIPLIIIFAVGATVFINEHNGSESIGLFTLDKGSSNMTKAYISNAEREVRGVYIATVYNINFPSKKGLSSNSLKEELDGIINTCLENDLNTVYFQASPNSDALYKSEILPTSAVLSGTEGAPLPSDFDPLEYICEEAKKHNISVHAWVNPMRVTGKNVDITSLSEDNPARLHPEWTVEYDSLTYYNLGVPEVRELAAQVCAEIAKNYDVDGVMFDDYFYPYPVDGQVFDDSAQYNSFGKEYTNVGDFRRAAACDLVKRCHDAVKEARSECQFGIAPFGVWRNNDGTNGGSDTAALQSYEALYCDTLEMIKEGSLDYVAPQLYWQSSFDKAPYKHLCDWWNNAVEGSGTKLIISHAAYQANDWQSQTEFSDQINYAREEKNYAGSIFYGYAALYENDFGVSEQIRSCYKNELVYTDYYPTGEEIKLTSYTREGGTVTVEGTSDPGYTLYVGGKTVSQKRDGSFSVKINTDETKITFTQNGKDYVFEEQK